MPGTLSGGRGRRQVALAAACVLVVALTAAGSGRASAAGSTTIDFEDLEAETLVASQYAAKGVVFGGEAYGESVFPMGFLTTGEIAVVPGPVGCDTDMNTPLCDPIAMTFDPPASRVKVKAGYNFCLIQPASVTMRAFDGSDQPLQSVSAPIIEDNPVTVGLEVVGGSIAKVSVEVSTVKPTEACSPRNRPLVLDDLEITTPGKVNVKESVAVAGITPDPVVFGAATIGGPGEERAVTVVSTGTAPLDVTEVAIEGADPEFKVLGQNCSKLSPLEPGASCRVDVRFVPTGVDARSATLRIVTNEVFETRTVQLKGFGAASLPGSTAEITKGPIEFGQARRGSPGQRRSVVISSTGAGPLNVDDVVLQQPADDFVRTANSCAASLAPGRSCTVEFQFRPSQLGARQATVTVVTGAARVEQEVVLQGTGVATSVPAATLSPAVVPFGRPGPGQRATLGSVRVTSSGSAPLTITGPPTFAGEHPEDFDLAKECSVATLPVEAYCTIQLRFEPGGGGRRTAVLKVPTTASDSPHEVVLVSSDVVAPGGLPTLQVSPAATRPATEVVARGSGYQVAADLYWDGRDGPQLASVIPDESGAIAVSVRIPEDATAGRHVVVGCDARQECAQAAVVALATAPPDDGGPAWWVVAVAAGLLVGLGLPLGRLAVPRLGRRPVAGGPVRPPPAGDGPLPPPPAPRERRVHTGFSPSGDYGTPLDPGVPLEPDRDYHFWLELDDAVLAGAKGSTVLTVAVFTYEGELLAAPGSDLGEVELRGDGSTSVLVQGGLHMKAQPDDALLSKRIFFPVRTPPADGRHRLRCSLYARGVLVQSWVVSADVRARGRRRGPASADPHRAERDFTLARTLDPGHLGQMAPHQLSIMVNQSGEHSHTVRVLGEHNYKRSADIGEAALASFGTELRGALRQAASGREDESGPVGPYRYAGPADLARLTKDLITLARRGRRIYVSIADELGEAAPADGRHGEERLRRLLRRPSRIQIANKLSLRHSLPAALLYDYKLDSTRTSLSLCPVFAEALAAESPLENAPCFNGECPSWEPPACDLVCPSGFWGFRHSIGVMQSLDDEGPTLDVPLLAGGSEKVVVAAMSADQTLKLRDVHFTRLRALAPLEWRMAATRADTLMLLAGSQPQFVYFYCHGGVGRGMSFLQVGGLDEDVISGDVLATYDVHWDQSHPLVIINGCHTTALGPSTPLDLVSAFVRREAAGVIGTEVTVYEPLACRFSEELVRRLVVDGQPVGDAVRGARLALLQEGNPLGLAYVPFAANDLVLSMGRSTPKTVTQPA